jgi:hypothetical protein
LNASSMSKLGQKFHNFIIRNSLLNKNIVITDDPVPCDTDLYLMLSIPNQTTIDHEKAKEILRKSLKIATLSKGFDFEVSTLRRFERSSKDQFLLLHTRVYGGAKKVEDHINYLIEADRIALASLKIVLDEFKIEYDKIIKQYIFYSQNLKSFKDTIAETFPKTKDRRIDDHTILFLGDIIIAISDEDRLTSTKLGRMMFDILEEIMNQPIIGAESDNNTLETVVDKYKQIVSIDRTQVKRASKEYFFLSIGVHLLLIILFLSFIYSYSCVFLGDYSLTAALLLILISISGLSGIVFLRLWNKQDVIYK